MIPEYLGSCEEKGRFCVLFQLSFRTLAKCFMSTSSSLSQLPASSFTHFGMCYFSIFPPAIVACVCVCVCSFVPVRSSCHSYCSLISLPLTRLCMMFELRSPCLRQQSQTFWHQGLVLWKILFPWTSEAGGAFRMIQVHYIYCALYFYYYCINSISDHQALHPGG